MYRAQVSFYFHRFLMFRCRFQGFISQKVDKIRPPDQHVNDQQHEKGHLKWNFKQRIPTNPLTKTKSLNAPK